MYHFAVLILLAYFGLVTSSENSTEWPISVIGKKLNSGAARQVYGSSALRPEVEVKSRRKQDSRLSNIEKSITQDPRAYDDDDDDDQFPHGVLITEPLHNAPPNVQNSDASYRALGGFRVPAGGFANPPLPGFGVAQGDIYGSRTLGERHGDGTGWKAWDRYDTHFGHHIDGFSPQHPIMDPESMLMHEAAGSIADGAYEDEQAQQPCNLACLANEFLCPRSCACVPRYYRCDGEHNCDFGEDEEECTTSNEEIIKELKGICEERDTHIMCPHTYACISKTFLCDGDDDCGDYSDETQCGGGRIACDKDQFECRNGLCIQSQWVCDGENDCKDFSDESNCTYLSCNEDEFECADGGCVSKSFRCDGEFDCMDKSDEEKCHSYILGCSEDEFRCRTGGSTGPGGRCILKRFHCDGDNDCGDWSDEDGCPTKSFCPPEEFRCEDSTCIPGHWRCDGQRDCDRGEDERNCTTSEPKTKPKCNSEEFQCADGHCILKNWVCDGFIDCKRAEDEQNCASPHCDDGQFACPAHKNSTFGKICVKQKHVCDGLLDCPNGEDEANCPTINDCPPSSKCEQLCTKKAKGEDGCTCKIGYMLEENGYNCTDIDECLYAIDPVCSQKCINTPGSYLCGCIEGYVLRPDLRTCKALGGAVKLIMASRGDIRQIPLGSNKHTSIIKGQHNAVAIDYHYRKGLLFWTDIATDVIKMAFMNGTGVRNVIKWGLDTPAGIAVDWIHDLLYWTDAGTRRIEVATFDGKLRAVIVATDLEKPRAIVVHPDEALVFWTDWGHNHDTSTKSKIERAYMDGSHRTKIVSDGVIWPNGLTLDYTAARLYWADAKYHVIESVNLDGSNRKKILSNHLPHPFALTIFEDQMFWTDWNTKSISSANKLTGKGFRFVHEGIHYPMDIHSFHEQRQPNYTSRCDVDHRGLRGGCSHLCLPNKFSRRCGCPVGLRLRDDMKTCSDVYDKLLLVTRKKDIRLRYISSNTADDIDMVLPLNGIKQALGVNWCSKNNFVYWTDVGRSSISRAHFNGSDHEHIITTNMISPAGLALDWVTDKLYWTDMDASRIEVATTDGRYRALLIWHGLAKPRDIVVSPVDGLMFWSDWGKVATIDVADMDGKRRRSLIKDGLQWPNGLSIDHSSNRLYFVDAGTKKIESVNLDGSGRRTITNNGIKHPFGIDVFGDKMYWTDWDTFSVVSANKDNGLYRNVLIANMSEMMDVRVFHRGRPPITNRCARSNGDCSDLCLLNPRGSSCACAIGVTLTNDNRTCHPGPLSYVLVGHRVDIRRISLDIDYMIDIVLPLPPMSNTMGIDIDTETGLIYWSDTYNDVISRAMADGSNVKHVVQSMEGADGLVIDSIGRKMYIAATGRGTVEVCELDGSNRYVLAYERLDAPRGIAIDYKYGVLFWTDWGTIPKIERAYMDGDRRYEIVKEDLGWPNGLSTDTIERRLYWADGKKKVIESCDYDGNNRRVIARDLQHPYGVSVTRHHVYWTDWKTKALHALEKRNISAKRVIRDGLQGLMDVKVVEDTRTPKIANVCGRNNGNCSHLCLRNPKGYTCKCPTGILKKEGSKTECKPYPENYLLVAMRSGISRISFDTPDRFDVTLPIPDVYGAVVLDYHLNESKLFYADVTSDSIKVVDLKNLSSSKTIISTGLLTPNGIAVDWLANNLFWSDAELKVIEVARLDGSSRKVIVSDDLVDPRSLIIYPKRGYVFWADWGQPRIERSYMDGSSRKSIVNSELGFPTGLSIDFQSRKLFWVDSLQDKLECSDFEGRKRSQIIMHIPHPFSVTMFESDIFWTDWYNKTVYSATKTGNNIEVFRHGLDGALDVRAVSRQRQPIDKSPCSDSNGRCTHLCLHRHTSYVCACPDITDSRECKTSEYVVPLEDIEHYTDLDDDDSPHDLDLNETANLNYKARIVIIATGVLGSLLIIVVAAILFLILNSKKKNENRTPTGSTRSVLTFSNPNYNGAENGVAPEPKVTIWKRLKYDKAQDRVYEVKCLGDSRPDTISTVNMVPTQSTSSSGLPRRMK